MLPKGNRLNRGIELILQRGAKFGTPFFMCRAVAAWDEVPRAAIIIAKKKAKRAVDRNRIRRRVYAALREVDFINWEQKYRLVFLCNASILTVDWQTLVKTIGRLKTDLAKHQFPQKPK